MSDIHFATVLVTSSNKTKCYEITRLVKGYRVELVRPGYTSTIQDLDVGVNKSFKDYLFDLQDDFLLGDEIRMVTHL